MIHNINKYNTNQEMFFKSKCGKDFYRDSLEYFEYDADDEQYEKKKQYYEMDDDEIGHRVAMKLRKFKIC